MFVPPRNRIFIDVFDLKKLIRARKDILTE